MNKKFKESAEAYLDERWELTKDAQDENAPDVIFYRGCTSMIEQLGLTWKRLQNGRHIIWEEK